MRDRREPLKKGTCINIGVGGGEYIVDECISSGGQALIYRCHLKGYENAQRYILKEYYPPEAVRENGVIVEGPEWQFCKSHSLEYYYEKARMAEENVALFRKKSHKAQFVSEVIPDDSRMVSLMRMASDDCKTIEQKLEEWYPGNPFLPNRHPDLYRVREGIKIIKEVLDVLNTLHGESCGRIVHRDLTPGNVFIAESRTGANTEYTIYPIDFSCSAPIGSPFDSEMSVSPGYTHPVLRENSHLLDLYSVAALLLVLVTGMECLHRIDNWEVNNLIVGNHFYIDEALTTLNIPLGVKSKLESVLKRAVSMRAADQYSSAEEMYTELETLEEIIDRREMHPEVLFDASTTDYKEQCESRDGMFRYEVEPDLVSEAIDCESNQPINLLEKNTILLGSGGAGKTTKIRTLWEDCLENWYVDRENSPIPIFVPLNTFDSSEDGKNFIKDHIAKRYFPNLSKDDGKRRDDLMGTLRSRGRYIIFLDGINEAVGSDKLNAEVAEFAAIENVTVLITSRNNLGDGWDKTKKLFSIAELIPLNDDLIIKKLHDKALGATSARLLETLRRPMFLAMYLKLKITDQQVETPGQILHAHHKHLVDAYKTGHHGEDWELVNKVTLETILPSFATQIDRLTFDARGTRIQLRSIIEEQKKNWNVQFDVEDAEKFFEGKSKNFDKVILDILINSGILRKAGQSSLAFTHQNYLDFYQTLDVYNQMVMYTAEAPLPAKLSSGILPETLLHFLGDLLGEHIIQTNRNRNTPTIEEWLQRNCANRGDYPAQIAIRNLIETMKISTGKQLQKRCFRNLDLTLANFYDCDLRGSDFSCAKIGDATFIRQGHDNPIDELLVIPEKNWILSSSSKENYIYFWDTNTGSQVGFIGGDNYPLSAPVLGLDRKTIIVNRGFEVALYDLESNRIIHDFAVDYADLYADLEKYLEEFCDEFFDKTQNYKWLSSDSKEVYFTTRGSTRLGVHSIRSNMLAKILDNSGDEYYSFDYPIRCCAMSADSKRLYLVLSNGQLLVWDTAQKTCLAEQMRVVPRNTDSIFLDSGEMTALIHTESNELHVINLRTGSAYNISTEMSMAEAGDKMLFAVTQYYFLWHDGTTLFSIDLDSCQFISILLPDVTCMCLDHENDRAFLGFDDGKIKIVDAKTLRVLSAFDCGEQNNWAEPHRFCPHWYDEGLARITKNKRIQCLTPEGFKTIPVDKTTCNYFEGNYHFCLVEESENLFMLVIDLRTGTIVVKIPFDSLCLAYNSKGEEIFRGHSGFCWAKYFPQQGKVIVNYTVGLIKIWDIDEEKWYGVGCWNQEIEHMQSLYDFFERDDWDMIEEHLFDISSRNHVFGNHIVQGTCDGQLLWWDFEGNLCKADHPHRYKTKIYAFPDSAYFISEGLDYIRCVWNWESMELIDSERLNLGTKRGNVLKIIVKQDILPALRDEHEEMRFWYERLDHTVLVCYEKGGYSDLKDICCKQDIVVYTTNHYICVCGLYDDKCDNEYLLRTSKTLLTEDVDSWVNYSLDGDLLAVAFADGTVKIFDIRKSPEKRFRFEWSATSATDVSECKFTRATVNGWIEYPLIMNGAYFDNEDARHSIEKHPVVRLVEQKEMLREEIAEDPNDEEKWIRLFSDFGSNMSGKELRHLIHDLQENFDDTGMRRAVFGNAIDDIYSDEENMLNSIPKTTDGLQTLCRYLSKHLECEYGFNMLFDDFGNVLDADTRTSMKELLLGNFNLDYLKWTYPHEFGFPDLDDEDMYDKNCLLYNDEMF